MAITALTLAAIGMGVGAAAKSGAAMIDASQVYTKTDKKRLEELERLQDLNALGLTDDEISVLQEQMLNPVAAMQTQRNMQRRELAAASDLGAGAVAKQMMMEEEAAGRAEADVARSLSQLDLQQKRAQEDEIRDLEKRKDVRNKAMLSAGLRGAGEIAQLGISAKARAMELEELTGAAGALTSEQQAQMKQQMMMQQYMRNTYGDSYNPYFSYYGNYYGQQGSPLYPFVPGMTPGMR